MVSDDEYGLLAIKVIRFNDELTEFKVILIQQEEKKISHTKSNYMKSNRSGPAWRWLVT